MRTRVIAISPLTGVISGRKKRSAKKVFILDYAV
jgi:hypothetical protein